jgi:hypothetical protein
MDLNHLDLIIQNKHDKHNLSKITVVLFTSSKINLSCESTELTMSGGALDIGFDRFAAICRLTADTAW